ncbi:MAG: hypothetical protein Q9169_001373 [Polycauliona sp. 2 TL-2023]
MLSKSSTGFVPVSSLSSCANREVNVIGLVIDFLPAQRSRGTDWMCSFRLADEKTYDEGFLIRYFKPSEAELPQVANGDVVILQRIKISQWSGMLVGISTWSTLWTVCPATSIPAAVPTGRIHLQCNPGKGAGPPTEEQLRSAIELCNSRDRTTSNTGPPNIDTPSMNSTQTAATDASIASVPSSIVGRRDKFTLLKDISANMFCDLVGQVVKTYPGNGVAELYITDYTSNNLLFNYGWGHDDDDQDSIRPKWPGPLGKHTLAVSLFPPHSYYATSNVEESQYVFLRNTRIKYCQDSRLEGCLHTDKRYPDRVDITIIKDKNDTRIKDLLRRKLEYGKRFSDQKDAFISMSEGQKRKQTEEPKLSKNQLKKQRKRAKQEEEARKKQQPTASNSDEEVDKENSDPYQIVITPNIKNKNHQLGQHSTPTMSPPPKKLHTKSTTLNENIRACNPEIPTRSLTSVLSREELTTPEGLTTILPFHNVKSRAAVRVVDFYPRNIADFAVRKKAASEYDVLSDYEGDSDSSSDEDVEKLPPDTDDEDNVKKDDRDAQSDANDDGDEEKSEWEWRFALILEDASAPSNPKTPNERMTLYVGGADAEFLLKIDACNLRRKSLRLAALGEKLFLLWGDLEEKMNAAIEGRAGEVARGVRSMPFVCCIKEYGVRSPGKPRDGDEGVKSETEQEENHGFERRFRMFGTTIL